MQCSYPEQLLRLPRPVGKGGARGKFEVRPDEGDVFVPPPPTFHVRLCTPPTHRPSIIFQISLISHHDPTQVSVIFDPELSIHTPEWLWLSTGVRSVDHATEAICSPMERWRSVVPRSAIPCGLRLQNGFNGFALFGIWLMSQRADCLPVRGRACTRARHE